MKTFKNGLSIYTCFLLLICFASCNGQSTAQKNNDSVTVQQTYTSKKVLLSKTQGSDEHQNIHCSIQDKVGNLWFGTSGEGVFQYDGNVFTQYTAKDGLGSNVVWSILLDSSGNVWFGTDDGVSRYDGKIISKVPFTMMNANGMAVDIPNASRNAVWSMMQDSKGIIWIGSALDLYCYNGETFSRFLDRKDLVNSQNLKLNMVQCIVEDSSGTIWFGSGPLALEGVIRLDGNTLSASKPSGDGWIRDILRDRNGNLWFSGRHFGVFQFDGSDYSKFKVKESIGSPKLQDRDGNIWFTGEESSNPLLSIDGVWMFDGTVFRNFSITEGMGRNSVWSIMQDKDGNIWIGTRNCGLFRYDGKDFKSYFEF